MPAVALCIWRKVSCLRRLSNSDARCQAYRRGIWRLRCPIDNRQPRSSAKSLRIGSKAVVSVTDHISRCMMITLDPDTAEKATAILKQVAQGHEGFAGVYGAALVEGMIRKGDSVELLD